MLASWRTARETAHAIPRFVLPQPQAVSVQIWCIVLVALLIRLLVITVGHTYRITPRRDHFQFAWEMGRIRVSSCQRTRIQLPN